VAQGSELHCLRDDRHVGRHFVDRILEVIGDPVDQKRDVIEQVLGWKDLSLVDCHAIGNTLQPTPGKLTPGIAKAIGEHIGKRAIVRGSSSYVVNLFREFRIALSVEE